MKYSELVLRPAYLKMLDFCIQAFNPTLKVSNDKKSILLNGAPIVSNDKTTFEDAALLNTFGYQVLRHADITGENQPLKCMAHNLSSSIYPRCTGIITEQFLEEKYILLDEVEQYDLMRDLNFFQVKHEMFVALRGILELSMRDYCINHSNNEELKAWFIENIDKPFFDLLKSGLKNSIVVGLHQYFEIAQNKDAITQFFNKYPHMIPMLRTMWEAHQADQERKIFNQLKTLADIERGDFMVEKYNQTYNYYNYGDCAQKFLADAESWQWLLTQSSDTIKTVMKFYSVNDRDGKCFAYHSFGRCRENLSMIAKMGLEDKLANFILKNLVTDSLNNDRFAIDIACDKEDLNDADFHSGQKYLNSVKLVFAYMDSKGMDLKTRIKFLKTFKHAITNIGFHVPYFKKHSGENLSDNKIIENWVQKQFKKLDDVNRNTYTPESV